MERRAKKRKASVMSDPPNKRRIIQNNHVLQWQKPIWSGPMSLLMLINKAQNSYMKETLGLYHKFRAFGDLRALGDISDPSIILVFNPRYNFCAPRIPALSVTDDNKRVLGMDLLFGGDEWGIWLCWKFELEVLLIGDKRYKHMFMCFKLSESMWILYDNASGTPFRDFDFKKLYSIKDVCVCLAIYVNETQADDYGNGIPETSPMVGHHQTLSEPMDQDSAQDLETLMQNISIC